MAGAGGKPGVAVQFVKKAFEVREELAPLIDAVQNDVDVTVVILDTPPVWKNSGAATVSLIS